MLKHSNRTPDTHFLLAAAQQISEVLVTNNADADVDGAMFMQASLRTRARTQFQVVQQSLEKDAKRQSQRAGQLRRMLQNKYLGQPSDAVHSEVRELEATW